MNTYVKSILLPLARTRTLVAQAVLVVALILSSAQQSRATHAMGMEITYRSLGGLNYEFTINFYRDCNSGFGAPGSANMTIQSTSCGINTTTNLVLISGPTDITPLCPAEVSNCSGGANPGFEQFVYQGTYTLPSTCSDYVFSYQIVNRNSMITNLQNAASHPLHVRSTLDNTAGPNTSPFFTTVPVPYICTGQPVVYVNGAIDQEGDSLTYTLVNALGNGGTALVYNAPYTSTYPLTTTTGTFPFDNITGTMSFTPNGLQTCAVSIRIDEYRAGTLIGSAMRDVQVVVVNCPANNQPFIASSGIINLSGGALIDSNSVSICAGVPLSFDIVGSDSDAGDILSMSTNLAQAIPGATFTTTGTNPVIGSFSWVPPTNSDVGFKPFTVTIDDDVCPIIGRQYVPFDILVLPSTYAGPDVSICAGGAGTQLSATGGTVFSWTPTTGLSDPSIANPIATPMLTTLYTVTSNYLGPCLMTDDVLVTVLANSGPFTGDDSVCTSSVETYSVPFVIGNTYAWAVTGGSITSGAGTNTITVNWGTTGGLGQVDLTETPSCNGSLSLPVNIHSLPTSSITGSITVATSGTGEAYSVTDSPGYTYTWTVTSGTVATGQGTSSITVNWGATAGGGNVQVVASSACGTAPAVNLAVTLFDFIESIASGNWNNSNTWNCNCNPQNWANIRINDGHTVRTTINERCKTLIVTSLGELVTGGNKMRVDGSYQVDGVHNTDGKITVLRAGTTGLMISGTGVVTNINDFRFRDRDYTVAAGTNLTFNCLSGREVRIYDDLTITNLGTVTIDGNLQDRNNGAGWINGAGSSFTITDELFVFNGDGTLDASATGNTIEYSGTVAQPIKTAVSSYFNLTVRNSGTKTPASDLDINGDLLLDNGATLNVSAGANITLAGDWTNIGSTFTPGANLVTIDGTGIQTMTNAGTETFNDLIVLTSRTFFIPTGNTALVGSSFSNSGTLDNDGRIILSTGYAGNTGTLSGNGTHELAGGNWSTTTGTFVTEQSTVLFSGSSAQTLQGNSTYYNLTLDNASGASIIGDTHLMINAMILKNGTFNTNNAVTFLSTAGATAFLAEIQPSANILGNITMQRYINSTITSWRFMSSAVTGQTLADWSDDIITAGFPGSDSPTFPFISIYRYAEAPPGLKDDLASYLTPTNITDPILDDEGYWVYVGPVPLTFAVTGPASKFSEPMHVTYNNSGSALDDGWNLVANPYPCAIDWDAANGWTRSSLDDAIYTWNPSNQQNTAYVAGVGTNGGSRYIPSQSGFYVHANAASPVLIANEPVKSNVTADQGTYRASGTIPLIRLEIETNASATDETVLRFNSGSTDAFEAAFDAHKLVSFEATAPGLSTISATLDFAINTLDELTNDVIIPLRATVGVSGWCTIKATDLSAMPSSSCILLQDLVNGSLTNLRTAPYYAFFLQDTTAAPRFLLHVGAPIQLETEPVSCVGNNDGFAIAQGTGSGPWDYEWTDDQGHVLSSVTGSFSADTLSMLSPGDYTVTVVGNSMCGTVSETVTISSASTLSASISGNMLLCAGESNGTLIATQSGGVAPYTYSWSTGGLTAQADLLGAGTHTVTITDNNGCTVVDSMQVTEPLPIAASFAVVDEATGCDGAATVVISGGTAGYSVLWDLAAGNQTTTTATGLCAGTYFVSIADANGCVIKPSVVVSSTIAIAELESEIGLEVYPNPNTGQFLLSFELESAEDVEITVLDIAGQEVYRRKHGNVIGEFVSSIKIDVAAGIYGLRIKTASAEYTTRISIR
jgi:hypothetical protein